MRRGRHREGQEFSTGIESSDLRGSGFSLTMAKPVLTVRRAEADYREKELKKIAMLSNWRKSHRPA
jgi:hypothetical protein